MDSVLACYAAGTGMIPATSRCFFYRLEVGSIKMETEKVKFCSSASIVDEKNLYLGKQRDGTNKPRFQEFQGVISKTFQVRLGRMVSQNVFSC